MNYPRPVNHVTVDEVQREPGGLFPGIAACSTGMRAPARRRSAVHYDPNYCQ